MASVLLIGMLAGCAAKEAHYPRLEQQPVAQAASHLSARAAPRPDKTKPNYHMAMVAKQMVGARYRYGGSSPSSGFDCSGLIYYSYQRIGLRSPRTTLDLYRHARPVHASELRTGDILFFQLDGRKVSHAGVYLGDGRMVHAPSSGKRVSYAKLSSPFWRSHFIGAGRLY